MVLLYMNVVVSAVEIERGDMILGTKRVVKFDGWL